MTEPSLADRAWLFLNWLFPDIARPMEYVALFGLGGWSWFLIVHPEVIGTGSYKGFAALPASAWAILMGLTAFVELLAIVAPKIPRRADLRFIAMALASGFWAVIDFNFFVGGVPSTGTHMYAIFAVQSALTGVWLGCLSIRS